MAVGDGEKRVARQGEVAFESIKIGPLEVRPQEYQLLVEGRRLHLTVKEFETLLALAEHHDRVITREVIYRRVWGGRMRHSARAVDTIVAKLRGKLDAAAPGWTFLHTHYGIGYRLTPEQS
jgi:DNA-binding response OmpR family regulator